MTTPQFPRDAGEFEQANLLHRGNSNRLVKYSNLQILLDSYHELQELRQEITDLRRLHKNVCELDKKEIVGLREELDALKAKMAGGVRVFISENGLLYRNLTDTKPNATLLLDKPEGA